jgi:aconitase A
MIFRKNFFIKIPIKFIFFISGLPAIIDLAAMRDAAVRLGADPYAIQPKISTTLLLDYYNIEADVARK